MDVNVVNSDVTLFCQFLVDAGVGPGDSGSPVFRWKTVGGPSADRSVDLYGILWGGNQAGTLLAFSLWGFVMSEFDLTAQDVAWCYC